MDNGRVNLDYIPVVRSYGNLLKLERVEIEKPLSLLSDLKVMMADSNCTIMDLHSRMCYHYSEEERSNIRFLSPLSYYSRYVSGVDFPHIYSEEKYEAMTQEKLAGEKRECYKACVRFIDAHSYQQTLNKCKEDPCIKMYALEEDGWNCYEHVINDDVIISVSTNFGYGNSTYFYLTLKYKGVSILPYSFIVRYYYADIWELRSFTRNYYAASENWNTAFSFVEEAVNLAAADTERFCDKFIKADIERMLAGLSQIVREPKKSLDGYVSRASGDPSKTYIGIKSMSQYDVSRYYAYPDDVPIVVMAEKVASAYYFLDNLSNLSEVYPFAKSAAEKIKEYIKEALPKIQACCSRNLRKIEECEATVLELKNEIEALESKKAEQEELIEEIYEKVKEEQFRSKVYKEYEESHPEYHQLKVAISDAEDNIRKCRNQLYVRKEFVRNLKICLDVLESFVLPARKLATD